MRIIYLAVLAAAALSAQGSDENQPNPVGGQPEAIEAGRKVFTAGCGACHGMTGEGGRGPNLMDGKAIRKLNDRQLFSAIQKGVPGTDMPPTSMPDEKIWQVAAFVRALSAPAYESIVPGNPDAGSAIFHGKGGCGNCHMVRGAGGYLGPDLSDIGGIRPLPRLRESLLKPGARITDGFDGVSVTFLDGKTVSGVAKNNNNYSMQILDRQGNLHLIAKEKLKEVVFAKTSLMPANYGQKLSEQEITDVLAFLSRQSMRPRKVERNK